MCECCKFYPKFCNTNLSKEYQLCDVEGILHNLKKMIMKSNESLQKDVQDAIKWEPLLNAAEIGVTVKDGIVTLTGTVDSYAKKWKRKMPPKMFLVLMQ